MKETTNIDHIIRIRKVSIENFGGVPSCSVILPHTQSIRDAVKGNAVCSALGIMKCLMSGKPVTAYSDKIGNYPAKLYFNFEIVRHEQGIHSVDYEVMLEKHDGSVRISNERLSVNPESLNENIKAAPLIDSSLPSLTPGVSGIPFLDEMDPEAEANISLYRHSAEQQKTSLIFSRNMITLYSCCSSSEIWSSLFRELNNFAAFLFFVEDDVTRDIPAEPCLVEPCFIITMPEEPEERIPKSPMELIDIEDRVLRAFLGLPLIAEVIGSRVIVKTNRDGIFTPIEKEEPQVRSLFRIARYLTAAFNNRYVTFAFSADTLDAQTASEIYSVMHSAGQRFFEFIPDGSECPKERISELSEALTVCIGVPHDNT